MIDDAHTTDTDLAGIPVLTVIRDDIALELHNLYCDGRHDDTDGPCWTNWRDEADKLTKTVAPWLASIWEEGARNGSRGLLPERDRWKRNPYRNHEHNCPCGPCYTAAMGGGR